MTKKSNALSLAKRIRKWEWEEGLKLWPLDDSGQNSWWSIDQIRMFKSGKSWESLDRNKQKLYVAIAARLIKEFELVEVK